MGIKELEEMFTFANGLVNDIHAKKEDDGKLSLADWISVVAENVPEGVQAVIGSKEALKEAKDLDSEEMKKIAEHGIELVQNLVSLFMGKK